MKVDSAATPPPAAASSPPGPRRKWAGLVVRKERWSLSARAWLLLAALLLGAGVAAMAFSYPFLAVTDRTSGEFLVVEGWVPPFCLQQAAALCKTGAYPKIFATGCTVVNEWGVPPGTTYAELGARRLLSLGLSGAQLQAVPSRVQRKDRTYYSALALKEWCSTNHLAPKSFDVLTLGPHARRTRLLFQKAFGNKVKIGIIAVDDQDYEPARWWTSSQGVREVVGESIAYLYVRLFFHPSHS